MTDYARGLSHEPPLKPERPQFSSGPTVKFPGWSLDKLSTKSLGRSHRSAYAKGRLKYAIDLSRELLGILFGNRNVYTRPHLYHPTQTPLSHNVQKAFV